MSKITGKYLNLEYIVIGGFVVFLILISLLKIKIDQNPLNLRFRVQCNLLTIWIVFTTIWPILWLKIVGKEIVSSFPYSVVGLIWTLMLFTIDILGISHHTIETEGENKKSMFTFDSNAISGLAFALGGVIVSNLGQDFGKTASPIFSSVILLCMAFLIPSPGIRATTLSGISIQTIQKSCIYCCIGLLVTALSINLSHVFKTRNLDIKSLLKTKL